MSTDSFIPGEGEETSASGGSAAGAVAPGAGPEHSGWTAAQLLGPTGPLAERLPGYECRDPQLQMATLVEDALLHQGIALCEAGTGTGKTLAYLVPALLSGQRVVVSTGTKTLQDQIMHKDLPLLSRLHFGEIDAVCMKGLSNYLCLRRYDAFTRSPEAAHGPLASHVPALERFAETTTTGDRAELVGLPEEVANSLFAAVQSGVETRIGRRCQHFADCHVTRMRSRAARAQLIVVNHHLLFADLALKAQGGGVIPSYDALILDEAHLVEDVATEFFGTLISRARLETLLRDVERALGSTAAVLRAGRALAAVAEACEQFFAALPATLGAGAGRTPLPAGVLPACSDRLLSLDEGLSVLVSLMRERVEEGEGGEALAQVLRRATQLRDDLSLFLGSESRAHVLWATKSQRNLVLGRSPIDVGASLRAELYGRRQAVVFTSATLSTSGDFTFIKQRLGIDFEVDELTVPSPFDYDQCAALYLPAMPDYRDPGYEAAAVAEIERLVALTGGGAFVLCTSLRAMRSLYQRCQLSVPKWVQGEAPNHELLERFRADGHAVLFATAGFWQGIDVPGEALRLVIIDKLPFDVPSDPVVRARCERLEAEGVSPFMRYVVPSAALTLKQGFGRLIRHRGDRGVVAVLDRRLRQKGYGKVFLRSLPPARQCETWEAVEGFWEG